MDSLIGDFWWQGLLGVALNRRDPSQPSKYIINLKLTKYSQWKLSGRLVCDFGQLELFLILFLNLSIYCQAQFQLASPVPVEIRLALSISLI